MGIDKYILFYNVKDGLKVGVLKYISVVNVCHFYGTTNSADFHIPKKRLTRKLGEKILNHIISISEIDYI